jgi:hypothetical protein
MYMYMCTCQTAEQQPYKGYNIGLKTPACKAYTRTIFTLGLQSATRRDRPTRARAHWSLQLPRMMCLVPMYVVITKMHDVI